MTTLTLLAFLSQYAGRTQAAYAQSANHFARFCVDNAMSQGFAALVEWILSLASDVLIAPGTYHVRCGFARQYARYLGAHEHDVKVMLPQNVQAKREYTPTEYNALLAVAEQLPFKWDLGSIDAIASHYGTSRGVVWRVAKEAIAKHPALDRSFTIRDVLSVMRGA